MAPAKTVSSNPKFWSIPLVLLVAVGISATINGTHPTTATMSKIDPGDTAWMLTATALVLLMTPGLSFFYGGMVDRRNVISTMLQSFIAMGLVSILWIGVGFSLAFGDSFHGIIGNPFTFLMLRNVGEYPNADLCPTIPLALFALFQLKFAIITPALITGAFAERVRFSSYMIFLCLFSIFIYAPLAHWTWHPQGFLRQWGVLDFAGGTVVHMAGGLAALSGAIFLGPRRARSPKSPLDPAHVPYVLLGTGMLWFGWFGFNAGSALGANGLAAKAFLTTNTASAAAMLTWLFLDGMLGRKPSAIGCCVGAVVGLVAITPGAGFVSVGSSLLIGVITACVSNVAVHWRSKTSIDDTLDVFPCHGVGGMVGMLLTAIFAETGGVITGSTHILTMHVLALGIVSLFVLVGSYLLYLISHAIIPMRVSEEEERVGLDLSQHDETVGSWGLETPAPAPSNYRTVSTAANS